MALRSQTSTCTSDGVNTAAEIFTEHGAFIGAVIRHNAKDKARAEDLFQDFFLSLVANPPPPTIQNVRAYLYRAITNDIVDAARRIENYRGRLHRYARRLDCATTKSSPEDALLEEEETDRMFEVIERRLPHSEAWALNLRYRHNHSIKEVAQKMGVKRISARRYVCVGLRKVRELFTSSRRDCYDSTRF